MSVDIEGDNKKLLTKVKLLESEITKLQESLEASKKFINVDATKVPINLYLVGKYNGFVKDKGLLSISVNGRDYYYTLESYGSARLPFPDARVLVFNCEGEQNTPYIMGFEKGRLIEPALTYTARLSNINFIHSEILCTINEYKNISLKVSEDFFKNFSFKSGEEILVRKIQVATEFFFLPILKLQESDKSNDELYSFLTKKL